MDLRNISAWSIRNPIVPIVLFAALMLMGVFSFMRMDIQQMPDIEFPAAIVTVTQPGAAPTEIENQITQRVESAVRSINGVQNISSTATEGSSTTFVEFQIGTDVNAAVNEVKNAVDQIRSELPDGILEPQVTKLKGSYDAGIKNIKISVVTLGGYCIRNTVPGTATYHKSGPSGDIKTGNC